MLSDINLSMDDDGSGVRWTINIKYIIVSLGEISGYLTAASSDFSRLCASFDWFELCFSPFSLSFPKFVTLII